MIEQRFQEILAELERFDFREMLNMSRECFWQKHKESEILAYFEVCLSFNWDKKYEQHDLEAEEIMPLLTSLSEESRFCLESISINSIIYYEDAGGVEQKFSVNEAWMSYSGDIQPHWQELHFRIEGGEEQVVSRSDLAPGCIVAQTSSGPLRVLSVRDDSLSLMVGTKVAELSENKEYLWEYLPGVEAALYYDHDEFPALWSWLHINGESEGVRWYYKLYENKEDLYEGLEFDNNTPVVKIIKISDRSLTLSISNDSSLQDRLHPKEVVLDQPNREVVIWEGWKCCLKAKLYVPAPDAKKSCYFNCSDPIPSGCRVTVGIVRQGFETVEYTHTTDVRTIPCGLMEGYNGGIYWNRLDVWGFVGGKMVVGINNPRYDLGTCAFRGLLSPGERYTFPINDDDGDHQRVHHGEITIGWETVEVGIEIQDGVLKSIPDVEEFTVPEGVNEMHFQSLLTAPSLRKITLGPGVKRFWCAINVFFDERHIKLDVVFEGSVQEWFDSACYLAGHIGRLVIQGKEYDFYETPDLVIPEGVSRIGDHLFSRSEVLRGLVLPPEVTEVGGHAFAYCDRLQSVKVLGPASIGENAFVSCHDLRDIYLADGVVSLGYGCFDFLTKVKSIFIPKSVERALILSSQNNGNCLAPTFFCAAPSKPSGWVKNWNLAYFDPRFGLGNGHDYYHSVKWGCKRERDSE